jgi:hypothetical protein
LKSELESLILLPTVLAFLPLFSSLMVVVVAQAKFEVAHCLVMPANIANDLGSPASIR